MDRERQEAVIEAVLFTMGESVEISKLAELIEESKSKTKKIVYEMRFDEVSARYGEFGEFLVGNLLDNEKLVKLLTV